MTNRDELYEKDEEKDKCETCEHKNDSSSEYCGSCGGGVESNWKEAGWVKDRTIKELRTRVAELEKENSKLRTINHGSVCENCSGLKKELEFYEKLPQLQSCEECNFPMTDFGTPRGLECQLCNARERIKEQAVDEEKLTDKCDELQTRLSTLLKASEVMEMALEEITKVRNLRYNILVTTDEQMIAIKALADFRALKETK